MFVHLKDNFQQVAVCCMDCKIPLSFVSIRSVNLIGLLDLYTERHRNLIFIHQSHELAIIRDWLHKDSVMGFDEDWRGSV